MKQIHKPTNVTCPVTRLEMEIEIRFMKPTDRVRDVMNDDQFKMFKEKMNQKGYQ